MANKKESKLKEKAKNNKLNAKRNVFGIVLGSVLSLVAASFAFLSIPGLPLTMFGLGGGGMAVLGVGAAIGATLIVLNSRGLSKKRKLKRIKQEDEAKTFVGEDAAILTEEKTSYKKEKKETEVVDLTNKKAKPVFAQPKQTQKYESTYQPTPNYKSEHHIDDYKTEKIAPNTFAFYDKKKENLLTDKKGENMIYGISAENDYRYALNELPKMIEDVSECSVSVIDASGNETDHTVSKNTYESDIKEVYNNIKLVRNALLKAETADFLK